MGLKTDKVTCPYCWKNIEIMLDPFMEGQEYVEDCSICCRPIVLEFNHTNENETEILASKENE